MGKIRIIGALGLVIGLVVVSATSTYATQTLQLTVAEDKAEKSLKELVDEAKDAKIYVSQHDSSEYPGLEKYLQKLIDYAETERIEDEAELAKALNEVIVAVPLLVPEEPVAKAKTTHQPAVGNGKASQETVAKVVAETVQKDRGESSSDLLEPSAESEVVELPNTGEVRKAGIGEFILAGAAVLLGTIGATILIMRSKKNA